MNLFTKQKQTHRLRERTYGYQRERWGGIFRELGIDMYTLLSSSFPGTTMNLATATV